MNRRVRIISCICLVGLLFLFGCKEEKTPGVASDTKTFFDTSVTLTIYGEGAAAALAVCFARCRDLEQVFSAQNSGSELYRINKREGAGGDYDPASRTGTAEFTVSDELRDAISLGLEAYQDTNGMFDITMLPVSDLWDFRTGRGKLPDMYLLAEEVLRVGSDYVKLDGNTLRLSNRNALIDLGAIAKGCISASLRDYLMSRDDVDGAILNLGGNIDVFGQKPDGTLWQVGIQKPFGNRGELIATVEMPKGCVISSGVYERCFTESGIFYHHILSPKDGMPVHSGISQATVIGTDDALADTLSTVCMLLGKDKSEELILEKGYQVHVLYTGSDGTLTLFDSETGEEQGVSEGTKLHIEP